MPPEKAIVVRDWLSLSKQDLFVVEIIMKAPNIPLGPAAFHMQQSVEKALKGFLTWHQIRVRKTHELEKLGKQAAKIDLFFSEQLGMLKKLEPYGVQIRYPEEVDPPTKTEAKEYLDFAARFYKEVLSRLPQECHPASDH